MSNKLKLPSNSSTPAKTKLSEVSALASPSKSSKYKNFLTSILTPRSRKWMRRKKSIHSEDSFTSAKGPQTGDEFNEAGYSSISDLHPRHSYNPQSSFVSEKHSDFVQNLPSPCLSYDCQEERDASSAQEEPLYAIVNKQRKKKNRDSQGHNSQVSPVRTSTEEAFSNTNIIQEQKEEIGLLVKRLREVTTENRDLHKNMETFLREQKWKEESLHAELKLKISLLEADTHKEVMCLSEQIRALQKEREVLLSQIERMHEEKKLLQAEHEAVCAKARTLVSNEVLRRTMDEHQNLLSTLRKKHLEEIKHLQQENENTLASKIELSSKVEELCQKVKDLVTETEHLKHSERDLAEEKDRMLLQLHESRQMQQESHTLILTLLKMTESIAVERDILLSKAVQQEEQHHLLKNSIVNHSLNMGRLQEHISNLSKEKLVELHKMKNGECVREEQVRHLYSRHLELLHTKVLNQSNVIQELEAEKSKLEMQLESVFQAGKPKLLDNFSDELSPF